MDESTLIFEVYTAILFFCSCVVVLWLLVSYTVLTVIRKKWLQFLERRFPSLEFEDSSIGAALDTPRNAGIVTLLLCVRGVCQIHALRRRVNEEVSRVDGCPNRRLGMLLTSRLGWYAWMPCHNFHIDNHVTVAPPVYRGRPITPLNVQEYVNEMVCNKYLVPELSPWQITVIPTSGDSYYLLLRLHHLLLTGNVAISLNTLLPIYSTTHNTPTQVVPTAESVARSGSLSGLYKHPRALVTLKDEICGSLKSWHNDALVAFDPQLNPGVFDKPDAPTALALTCMWALSFVHGRAVITLPKLLNTIKCCVTPIQVLKSVLVLVRGLVFRLPIVLVCELYALTMIHDERYSDRSIIKYVLDSWMSMQAALREVGYFWRLLYHAPRTILEEMYGSNTHYLHTTPHRGRKVMSWSQPIPVAALEAIEGACGASPSDILLTATAAALRDLYLVQDTHLPSAITAYARTISLNELFGKPEGCGLICLQLPLNSQWEAETLGDGPITELRIVQQGVLRTRLRQSALFLATLLESQRGILSKCLPDWVIRLILNHLTRRISVNITYIVDPVHGLHHAHLWEHPIQSLMYWPPLQANSCLSLTLLTHGDTVTLGVMADSAMAPHHNMITATWASHVRRLAAAAGVGNSFPRPRPLRTPPSDADSDGSPTSSSTTSASDVSSDGISSEEDC